MVELLVQCSITAWADWTVKHWHFLVGRVSEAAEPEGQDWIALRKTATTLAILTKFESLSQKNLNAL